MVLHRLKCKREVCWCAGYHYAHRPGSKFCDRNPMGVYWQAVRRGESDEVLMEIQLDVLWNNPGRFRQQTPDEPPF